MKQTRRLKLTGRQAAMHYFPALVIAVLPGLIYFLITWSADWLLAIILGFSVMQACLYAARQYRSLKFTELKVSLDEKQFRQMFESLSKQMHWIQEFSEEGHIVATTEFRWTNWGTLVTLIRDEKAILANSICDLYKRPSTLSWGQNRKNINALKAYIEQYKVYKG